MYEKIEHSGTEAKCALQCLLIQSPKCTIAVFDSGQCFLGNGTPDQNNFSTNTQGPWNIGVTHEFVRNTTNLPSKHAKRKVHNVSGEQWSQLIYQSITDLALDEACDAYCTLHPLCHFFYRSETLNECYLGNLLNDHSVIPLQSGLHTLMVESESLSAALKYLFLSQEDAQGHPVNGKLYMELATNDLEDCTTSCHWDEVCQFVFLSPSHSNCFLGRMSRGTNLLGLPHGTLHFKNATTFASGISENLEVFLPLKVFSTGWFEQLLEIRDGPLSLDQCGLHCYFYQNDCTFMVFKNHTCFLGRTTERRAASEYAHMVTRVALEMDTVYLNWRFFDSHVALLFLSRLAPGSEWSPKAYDSFNVLDENSCKFYCHFFGPDCNGFLFDPSTNLCYLTRENVNSGRYLSSQTLIWHYLEVEVGIILGGHELIEPYSVDGNISIVDRNAHTCYSRPIPDLNALNSHDTPIIDHNNLILICGGYSPSTQSFLDSCYSLDLTAMKRSWTPTNPMNSPRTSFHLFSLGDSIVAIGGYNGQGHTPILEQFDISSKSWSTLKDTNGNDVRLPGSISCWAHSCLLDIDETKAILIGGRNCDGSNTALSECIVFNKSTLTFDTCPRLNQGRHSFGCMVDVGNEQRGVLPNLELIVMGGYDTFYNLRTTVEYLTLGDSSWIAKEMFPSPAEIRYVPLKTGNVLQFGFNGIDSTDLWTLSERDNSKVENRIFRYTYDRRELIHIGYNILPPRAYPAQTIIDGSHLWTCPNQAHYWILIQKQRSAAIVPIGQWDYALDQPDHGAYTKLSTLTEYISCDDYFYFRMVWPDLGYYNEWRQTSDPTQETEVLNFQEIAMRFKQYFIGLYKSDNPISLMSANDNSANLDDKSWQIGLSTTPPNGALTQIWDQNTSLEVDHQLLYIRKTC